MPRPRPVALEGFKRGVGQQVGAQPDWLNAKHRFARLDDRLLLNFGGRLVRMRTGHNEYCEHE